MAIRRLLAERMSGLKKAGAELPIISEVAVPAKIIKQEFVEPYLDVRRAELTGILGKFPSFAYGTAYGETAGQWYRVTYPKTMAGAVPVCVAEGRTGAIATKAIERVSDIGIRTITIPKVGIRTWHCKSCDFGWFSIISMTKCPECSSYSTEELTVADRYEKVGWYRSLYNAKKRLGNWTWGFWVLGVWVGIDINWIRDIVATVFAWFGYYMCGGNGVFVMADALSSQVDNIRGSIESNINSVIRDINDRIKRQIDFVTDRVNLRLNDLYAMWGIPSNMAVTPVHTRNCTDNGFDFQSYGKTTVHYIAIGTGFLG